jgi:small subunit ribosomal protein S2e
MEVKSVQKQTQAGQRTRFKAFAIVGDGSHYIGLGWKCHKEVQGAIKGAITMAKLNLVPVRKGYWGNKIGATHTVPCKVTGKSGSVKVRLIPAPRGAGLVAPPVTKKLFQFAGIQDVYTKTEGKTRTRGNFVKAAYAALGSTPSFTTLLTSGVRVATTVNIHSLSTKNSLNYLTRIENDSHLPIL